MKADRLLTMPTTTTTSIGAAGSSTEEQRQHQPSVPLKCPRCDSSNTKFCYYNNYSLSQPRHFCKACKRYWTRGGTLRNVPVGGGCRKNKRVKKSGATTTTSAAAASRSDPAPPPFSIPTATHNLNSLFYSKTSDMGAILSFPSIGLDQESNTQICSMYDLQPQLNALGLGLPHHHRLSNVGFVDDHLPQLQQPVTTSVASILHDYPMFGSPLPATTSSFAVSSIKQQPRKMEDYQSLLSYQELQASGNLGLQKEVKVERSEANGMGVDRIEWQMPCDQNSFEAVSAAAGDSSFMYWNPAAAWPEAPNCGSSATPLI